MSEPVTELLQLNVQLLNSIARDDWQTYAELSDPSLTAFEPEARGHLVEGLEFHHFYFKIGSASESNTTMVAPQVRVMGDVAVVAYVRLIQSVDTSGVPTTARFEETRVWQRTQGQWRQVHFHRS